MSGMTCKSNKKKNYMDILCVHVFICVDKTLRFNENPCEGWGHLLINILIRHWLAEQKMPFFFFFFLMFGVMDSPSLLLCVGSLASDRQKRAIKAYLSGKPSLPCLC